MQFPRSICPSQVKDVLDYKWIKLHLLLLMIPEIQMQQLLKIYGEENDLYCVGTNEWISANLKYVKYISN